MRPTVRIFHNPGCSKCRQSIQLLENQDLDLEIVEYLQNPPSVDELGEILALLGLEPRELMRKHEAPYTELNLDNDTLSREALIQAMVDHPVLIERPIVVHGKLATIGRPPQKILEIL